MVLCSCYVDKLLKLTEFVPEFTFGLTLKFLVLGAVNVSCEPVEMAILKLAFRARLSLKTEKTQIPKDRQLGKEAIAKHVKFPASH